MKKSYSTFNMRQLLILPFFLLTCGLFAQPYNFDGLSAGATGTFTNGWVGTPTTNFSWRADNNGTGSGGTGPAVDHTLGTPNGIYMYTEASSPAAQGDTADLESPNVSLASFTNPAMSFWYHKAGSAMGDLYVDIFNGTAWVNEVDSIIGATQASETDPWLEKIVDLSAFSGTIRVRFRAICGAGFSGDMAVDDVSFFELPPFDLALSDPAIAPVQYYMYPQSQSTGITFSGVLNSVGASALTNATMRVDVGSWADSVVIATLASGASAMATTTALTPQPNGFYTANYTSYAVENDTNLTNNDGALDFYITDSIYARDDSLSTGSLGIGPGTAGILGQNFVVNTLDTMTTVSFFLTNPTIGDTAWVSVHAFGTTPGAELGRTDDFIIPTDTASWYTLSLQCPLELVPGTYFVGMNETDGNITLGTTPFNFGANQGWVIFGANPWQPSEFYGFAVTYLLRANFGMVNSTANAGMPGQSSVCDNNAPIDLGTVLNGTPDMGGVWTDNSASGALTGSMVDPSVAGAGVYSFTYTVTDSCGYPDATSVTLVVTQGPDAGTDGMTVVCSFDGAFDLTPLIGTADVGGTWLDDDNSGALTGSMVNPMTAGQGMFNFSYVVSDSLCGADTSTVTVTVNLCPAIDPAIELSFQIFPNPNQGLFKIEVPSAVGQNLEVRVLDLMGKEVYAAAMDNAARIFELDLRDVAAGVYIVELNNGETRTQGRLIKE